jgi:hypothetical protein
MDTWFTPLFKGKFSTQNRPFRSTKPPTALVFPFGKGSGRE